MTGSVDFCSLHIAIYLTNVGYTAAVVLLYPTSFSICGRSANVCKSYWSVPYYILLLLLMILVLLFMLHCHCATVTCHMQCCNVIVQYELTRPWILCIYVTIECVYSMAWRITFGLVEIRNCTYGCTSAYSPRQIFYLYIGTFSWNRIFFLNFVVSRQIIWK